MSLIEKGLNRFLDSVATWSLKQENVSVHTSNNLVGRIIKTDILRGKVWVESNSGAVQVFRGMDVADLDTPLVYSPRRI